MCLRSSKETAALCGIARRSRSGAARAAVVHTCDEQLRWPAFTTQKAADGIATPVVWRCALRIKVHRDFYDPKDVMRITEGIFRVMLPVCAELLRTWAAADCAARQVGLKQLVCLRVSWLNARGATVAVIRHHREVGGFRRSAMLAARCRRRYDESGQPDHTHATRRRRCRDGRL